MAFFEKDELKSLYKEACDEALEWRRNYPEYERLADNGLLEDIDETLPETNDGSLSAGLFKLPKRVVKNDLSGTAKALDADDAWVTELANIYLKNRILPKAKKDAPYKRKVKDVVRKAATYGGQPVICLMVEDTDGSTKADFIVPYAQDVKLEPGKVSDLASDIIFWEVYYTRKQVRDMIETAKKESTTDTYNKWDVKALQAILDSGEEGEDRPSNEDHEDRQNKSVTKGGIKFCVAFQRGIEAPFYMYHSHTDKVVREWANPDPTGDIPVKYLYWYQDFINPYGVGVVKLAGGTQNVLDIMRRYDVLATQIGVRPPRKIKGNEDEVDEDSMIYAPEQNWYVGNAEVETVEMANGVYNQLPTRVQMYQSSLNKFIPMGDATVSATAGDPMQSKTPAGVKQAQASLSIDDEDIVDNLNEWWESVVTVLINLTFANMQGSDLLKLSDEERDRLMKAGLEFPLNEEGMPTNELEILWDEVRHTFQFVVDAEENEDTQNQEKIEGLTRALELRASDPNFDMAMQMSGKRFNLGEAYSSLIQMISKNDKIIEDIDPQEMEQLQAEQMAMQEQQMMGEQPQLSEEEQAQLDVEGIMQQYGVDKMSAIDALMDERNGVDPEQIKQELTNAGEMARSQNA